MLLKDYFSEEEVFKDKIFNELGYSHSSGKNLLTFCDNINYLTIALNNKDISVIIITKDLLKGLDVADKGICVVKNPRDRFFDLYRYMVENDLFEQPFMYGKGNNVNISSSSIISEKSYIGSNTIISENVVIKDNVCIGDNCFIDTGVVIGNHGILYTYEKDNISFIKHGGIVEIGNNVTLLSNSVVVRSIFPNMPTKIEDYSIIGIATTIGHESRIGKNCRILGNCVVAKSAQLGDKTIIGSSSVIRENITLGKNVDVKAGSIVIKDIKDGGVVSGNFALEHNQNVRNYFKSLK